MPTGLGQQARALGAGKLPSPNSARSEMLLTAGPGFLGFCPDLPDDFSGMQAFREGTRGLKMVRPSIAGASIVLGTGAGFSQVDGATQPLNSSAAISRLQSMLRTDETGQIGSDASEIEYDLTLIVTTVGDGSTGGTSHFFRTDSNGAWAKLDYVAHNGYTSGKEASANIDGNTNDKSMMNTAVFPAGSPSHNPTASISGYGGVATTLGLPVMIFCNNVDPVYVFPASPYDSAVAERHDYTELHAGALEPFKAKSCFSWEGRMFYGNTEEGGNRYKLRIRWSSLFDASPDPANSGAGAFDIRDLQGSFLTFENLDPYLIAYFTDGIVFLERTGLRSAPHVRRVITDHRGLLGPHSVSHISPNEHFIITTDGFYIMNGAGNFNEIGTISDGVGNVYRKWHDTFFSTIDLDKAHRVQCHYNQITRQVHIVFPNRLTGIMDQWTWDVRSDTMWPDNWEVAGVTTCFADHNSLVQAALAWNSANAPTTWEDLTSTGGAFWSSGAARFGRSFLHHGTVVGEVYQHDQDIHTFDGHNQEWALVTKSQQLGGDPRLHHTIDRGDVEFFDLGTPTAANLTVLSTDARGEERMFSGQISHDGPGSATPTTKGITGKIGGGYTYLKLSGSDAVAIRRLMVSGFPGNTKVNT